MNITHEKQSELLSTIQLEFKVEDYEPRVTKEIRKLSKVVHLKGFRPGTAPFELVKKIYGNSVLADEVNNQVKEVLYNYIKEHNLQFIASPLLTEGQSLNLDINHLRDFSMKFELGHAPEVDLSFLSSAPPFTLYKVRITDEDIDKEIIRIRKRYGEYVYPNEVGDQDVLSVKLVEINEDGTPKEWGISTNTTLAVDLLKDNARNTIKQCKVGESIVYDVFELLEQSREKICKHLLNLGDDVTPENINNRFQITIDRIIRIQPADINETLLARLYGDNHPRNEAELRERILQDETAIYQRLVERKLLSDIHRYVKQNIPMPLPEEFLRRWFISNYEDPAQELNLEKEFPEFLKSLRWGLVQEKVINEQNINVTPEEIKEHIREKVRSSLFYYYDSHFDDTFVEVYTEQKLKDEKVVSDARNSLLNLKVLNYLKGFVNTQEVEISTKEANEL
ncbi:MAG: hypothetical protein NZM35_08715 [Chitinophagales bacterium]|nr:hypothetical protein [Chitinophagales bacterium]MDW8418948.1 trigger factor [Chitinophagales bacterium]